MGKDHIRDYLAMAVEAYDLSATPTPASIFRDTTDECESVEAIRMPSTSRRTLLDISLDVKKIFTMFMDDVYRRRGSGGCERFLTWVKVGYIDKFHTEHREQIREDKRILGRLLRSYRFVVR